MRIPQQCRRFISRASHAALDALEDLIALRRAELDEPPEPPAGRREVIKTEKIGKMTIQHELVSCGKACKTCKGKGKGHGPYKYGYFWDGGRVRSIYLGKSEVLEA